MVGSPVEHPATLLRALRESLEMLLAVGEGDDFDGAAATAAATLRTIRQVLLERQPQADALRAGFLAGGAGGVSAGGGLPGTADARASDPAAHGCILELLLLTLRVQEFESRKDTEAVVGELLAASPAAADCITPQVLQHLCEAYESPFGSVALNSGNIMRIAIRHETILRRVLNHPPQEPPGGYTAAMFEASLLRRFFKYVDVVDFEVASDAFWTFREVLTCQPALTAEYLQTHFTPFFAQFSKLLQPQQGYVARRQGLKILGELLLNRINFQVMQRFTQSSQYLKSVMVLLKDPSSHIAFEAFHVFKLFVANPKKPDNIKLILALNKEKLLGYFEGFGEPKAGEQPDKALLEERRLVVREISSLQPVAKRPGGGYTSTPQQASKARAEPRAATPQQAQEAPVRQPAPVVRPSSSGTY